MKFLLIHGVGHAEADGSWESSWQIAIRAALASINPSIPCEFEKLNYDDQFTAAKLDPVIVAEAVTRLMASGVWHGIGDLFRKKGLGDDIRWTAGMVAQWAADEGLRSHCNSELAAQVNRFRPDVICAHSLGTLISYDTFARNQELLAGRTFVTFGSQIGNPFVRSVFGGRIMPLNQATNWYHLYNREDDVLTAEIDLNADNFQQVTTYFDISGFMDHDPIQYLSHPNTFDSVWRPLADQRPKSLTRSLTSFKRAVTKPKRRALLVGINDYPNPGDCLEGCVNDVYLMSSVLQERGYDPENIRVVLNERATAAAVRERLEWLLTGVGKDDQRFFYYSGHGAQLPGYGGTEEVDHLDECLVTCDFDWTKEHAITDDWFCRLYSQLPYSSNFISVLDCCHSGGMTRSGSLKVRGLDPPDDIRHRSLRWDQKSAMWLPRELGLSRGGLTDTDDDARYTGRTGAERRIGRAVPLWTSAEKFRAAKETYGHSGPYTPTLLEACREEEYSYEYRHGVTSFGAFTYCLAHALRQKRSGSTSVTWAQLVKVVAQRLKSLQFQQTPILVAPREKLNNAAL